MLILYDFVGILLGFSWDLVGILGQKQQLELLTGAMDAMDASFQAQTVATHALQNTGKALPQLCTVELCNLLGFQHPMAWLSHFIFMEVLFGLWESRCDLRSAKHVLGLPSCFHVFFFEGFLMYGSF